MPRKTSFYLSDSDDALLRAKMEEGIPLKEVMRRGIGAVAPDLEMARAVAAEAVAAVEDELDERIDRAVERAFAKRQGGSW